MKRICSYCRKTMGEKCGQCGSLSPVRIIAGPPARWKCVECGAAWEEGEQRPTHGICDDCIAAARAQKLAAERP